MGPLVYRRTMDVKANPYWGIVPYQVDILYVYIDRCPEFEQLLPQETQAELVTKSMKGFPTDLPAGLYLLPRIIKLMAAQSEYTIKQNQLLFQQFFQKGD